MLVRSRLGAPISVSRASSRCSPLRWAIRFVIADIRAKEAKRPFSITYRLSKEGNLVWADVLAIPADAPRPEAAHAFIYFVMRPQIAAAAANDTGFSTANEAALPMLDGKIDGGANLYPSAEAQKRFHLPKALDQKALKMWSSAWNRAKGLEQAGSVRAPGLK
ncbi:extracellular solute-binding protein [Nostoc ellipsosporum NOK]|nr:extracellular solute-binding protein [Nostoc ellipsosporum NOK]